MRNEKIRRRLLPFYILHDAFCTLYLNEHRRCQEPSPGSGEIVSVCLSAADTRFSDYFLKLFDMPLFIEVWQSCLQ